MDSIITYLIAYNQYLITIIGELLLFIVQYIASLFVEGSGSAFLIGIAGGIIAGMVAARIYKIKYYPFRLDSIQHLHFKNKEYQQLFDQANPGPYV